MKRRPKTSGAITQSTQQRGYSWLYDRRFFFGSGRRKQRNSASVPPQPDTRLALIRRRAQALELCNPDAMSKFWEKLQKRDGKWVEPAKPIAPSPAQPVAKRPSLAERMAAAAKPTDTDFELRGTSQDEVPKPRKR